MGTDTQVSTTGGTTTTIDVHAPADGRLLGRIPDSNAAQVAELAKSLRQAQPAWEALGPDSRRRHLLNWVDWILDNEQRLIKLIQDEAGKSTADASIEITIAVDLLNYYAKHAKEFLADRTARPAGVPNAMRRLRVEVRPHQLVGLITPWNGPLASPMMDATGALAAGAAVLSKPSEITPLTWTEAVRGWNEDLGAPPILGCVNGGGATGAAVVDLVDMVSFTGSVRTGRKIASRAGERLIPCSLELGGKDAMIVLDDADLERAANAAIWGGLNNVGQACISVERVYVEDAVYDRFVELVRDKAAEVRVGVDSDHRYTREIGAMVTEAQIDIVESHIADAVAKGARILLGGKRVDGPGNFFEPTILVDVDHSMSCMREETFGPTLPIMRVRSQRDALEFANDSQFGLSSSVFSKCSKRADWIARRIEAGSVAINNVLIAAFQLPVPMGGWKQSGVGTRFGGAHGVLKYCREKSVISERMPLSSEPIWFPVSPRKGRVISTVARFLGANDWRRKVHR